MLNAQHLKMVQSLTLTELYIQLKLLPSLVYSVLILLKKTQKWWSHTKKHAIYGPCLWFVSVLHENGTVSDRYENNLCRVSDPHEVRPLWVRFRTRPVPCKRMKRNVWRAIRTHTGPSASRSHVITPWDSFPFKWERYGLRPVWK